MDSLSDIMTRQLSSLREVTNEKCKIHNKNMIKALKGSSEPFCEECLKENIEKKEQTRVKNLIDIENQRRTQQVLIKDSILLDKTISEACFESFNINIHDEEKAFNFAQNIVKYYKSGNEGNTVLTGPAGSGKSHLAMSILKEYNKLGNKSALFVSFSQMIRIVKDSFGNYDNFNTQSNMLKLLSEVDLLVLDDLGSEKNTEFTEELLTDILDSRTRTIITTNLSSSDMEEIYKQRTVSRVLRGMGKRAFRFDNIKDKRINQF